MQASEANVLAQVESVRDSLENLDSSTFILPLDPSHIDPEPTDVAPDASGVPAIDEATVLP